MVTNFFLGANSSAGFQSLYEGFVDPEKCRDVMVLKGGPGVGKSSFMKYIGQQATERGEDVEYIWCSGDPDSLDAVRLVSRGVVVVDGTSPHVVEPQYPAAVDRYVNLGQFYRVEELKELREAVVEHTRAYKGAYRRAYRALKAAGEVEKTLQDILTVDYNREKLERRTKGIIAREIGKQGSGRGEVSYRFLGGVTCQGAIWRFDTVEALASRIYELQDECGIGAEMLGEISASAVSRGYDVILCPNGNQLQRIEHLMIPELRLAFLTSREGMCYEKKPYRRIHLNSLLSPERVRQNKARCRFHRRMRALLLEEGIGALKEAKAFHDQLERVYNPHVDFEGVYALARKEWERVEKWL